MNEISDFKYVDYFDDDKEKLMQMYHGKNQVTFVSKPLKKSSIIKIRCDKKPDKILLNKELVEYDYDTIFKIAKIHLAKNKEIKLLLDY